jgi:hypothetical protein
MKQNAGGGTSQEEYCTPPAATRRGSAATNVELTFASFGANRGEGGP